jgi:hypothetical protein
LRFTMTRVLRVLENGERRKSGSLGAMAIE